MVLPKLRYPELWKILRRVRYAPAGSGLLDLQLRSEEHREFLQQLWEEKTGINKTKGMEDPFAVIVHSFFDGRASLIQQ